MPDLKLVQAVVAVDDEKIVEHLLQLGAIDYKIGGRDAVKEFWKDEPEKPLPASIAVQFNGKKN